MNAWARWAQSGAAPLVVGLVWAISVAAYLARTPVVLVDGEPATVPEAGGLPALVLVILLPIVLAAVPLLVRAGRARLIVTVAAATLLTLALGLGSAMLLYLVTPASLWWAAWRQRSALDRP